MKENNTYNNNEYDMQYLYSNEAFVNTPNNKNENSKSVNNKRNSNKEIKRSNAKGEFFIEDECTFNNSKIENPFIEINALNSNSEDLDDEYRKKINNINKAASNDRNDSNMRFFTIVSENNNKGKLISEDSFLPNKVAKQESSIFKKHNTNKLTKSIWLYEMIIIILLILILDNQIFLYLFL